VLDSFELTAPFAGVRIAEHEFAVIKIEATINVLNVRCLFII